MSTQSRNARHAAICLLALLSIACSALPQGESASTGRAPPLGLPDGPVTQEQVLRGRELVINRDCGACHGGWTNPAAKGWLAGESDEKDATKIGPFLAWPRNLTPDDETGLGKVSERQIFNSLRYGLRPSATPDVEVTSSIPGQGNHPAVPDYLSPGMPWLSWRFMRDDELWAIAAYLKHGVKAVSHRVPKSGAPPDLWAGEFAVDKVGTHLMAPFPTQHEELGDPARRDEVLQGRALVASIGCPACHGGAAQPTREGWMDGVRPSKNPELVFEMGPFKTYPRNLTPDNATGIGRFSEQQLFNSLRYGLRPGDTPDIEITSAIPGRGNHPVNPKYLAPPMVWPSVRYLPDAELRAIVAYLKYGLKPVRNRVQDSEGPPDFWAGEYTAENIGSFPAGAYPTANERPLQ